MFDRINTPRVLRSALFCALAGFIVFLILEPNMSASDKIMFGRPQEDALWDAIKLNGLLASFVAFALVLIDDISNIKSKKSLLNIIFSVVIGYALGGFGGYIAQSVYSSILKVGTFLILPIARFIGWSIMGVACGLSYGIVKRSPKLILLGILGGIIGGGIGGGLFDLVALITFFLGGTISRLIGFTVIGLCVGASVTLLEEAAKQAWIKKLVGRNEGYEYIINKPIFTIGKDELADLPLFGDSAVLAKHAYIDKMGNLFRICKAQQGAFIYLNNLPVNSSEILNDGDIIQIASFRLEFKTKSARAGKIPMPSFLTNNQPQTFINPQSEGIIQSGDNQIPSEASLLGVMGAYINSKFVINSPEVKIGREPSNTIALNRDQSISRFHALINQENGKWIIKDLGSSNGTFVNSTRIQQAVLNNGDVVHFGGSAFKFGF